jgi:hypothetical protein
VQIFNAVYFLKSDNNNNLVFYFKFFIFGSRKFGQLAISTSLVVCFFSWTFCAAGGYINLLSEGNLNLEPPLKALLNSHPD